MSVRLVLVMVVSACLFWSHSVLQQPVSTQENENPSSTALILMQMIPHVGVKWASWHTNTLYNLQLHNNHNIFIDYDFK